MPIILCNINLFDANQKIYVFKEEQEEYSEVPMHFLDRALIMACYRENIYDIHLFGLDKVVNELKDNINKKENLLFSQNKIKVEVN